MDEVSLLVGALVALSLLVATLLLAQRQQRRQMEALLERLEALESTLWTERDRRPEPEELPVRASSPPSADVLAGRSSFVRHAVAGDGIEGLAAQAVAAVHGRVGEPTTPSQLADALHLSLRTLERGLAAALGCSPRQLILAMKMREARRLLDAGHLQVSEIAYRLGYASPAHFSRVFRRFYRVPPSQRRSRGSRERT